MAAGGGRSIHFFFFRIVIIALVNFENVGKIIFSYFPIICICLLLPVIPLGISLVFQVQSLFLVLADDSQQYFFRLLQDILLRVLRVQGTLDALQYGRH